MSDTKTILVTGASSGIGHSIASQLLEKGHRVIGTSRNKLRLKSLKIPYPDQFYALNVDSTDPVSCDSIISRLPAEWQEIDVLVNNAGSDIGGRVDFDAGDPDDWVTTVNTNVNGVMRVTYAVLKGMRARNRGIIINIGSTSGLDPVPTTAAYSASKHAINGFSEAIRKELEPTAIRVMQVLPGMVRTEFAANRLGDSERGEEFYDNFGKWLSASDVADCVLFCINLPIHVEIPQLVVVPKPVDHGE